MNERILSPTSSGHSNPTENMHILGGGLTSRAHTSRSTSSVLNIAAVRASSITSS